MKGSKTDYSRTEALSGVQGFILKHIQNLDKVFCDLKKAKFTVAEAKSQWCISGIGIISFICDSEKHHSDNAKILKIVE